MMLLSDTIVDFHLFYDGAVDIQIWALLTRSQCKVSDTQVTIKAHRPRIQNRDHSEIIITNWIFSGYTSFDIFSEPKCLHKINFVQSCLLQRTGFYVSDVLMWPRGLLLCYE